MALLASRQLGRADRYVRRARLSLGAEAPRHKLTFMLEESLRLCSLPGEQEGRAYYFRYLRVEELPENGDREVWLSSFQQAVAKQAARAVPALLPGASASDAVYFLSEQDACEAFLMMLVARVTPTAWFWEHVSGVTGTFYAPAAATAIVKKLLATPPGWSAVAAAVFSVACNHQIAALLKVLPGHSISGWLRDLGPLSGGDVVPIRFSRSVLAFLLQAISTFGAESAQTLWLACLAVIRVRPSSLSEKSVVALAQASLRTIIADSSSPKEQSSDLRKAKTSQIVLESNAIHDGEILQADLRSVGSEEMPPPRELPAGENTDGAGLYFLLNALLRLEGEQKLSLLFLAQLFFRIALQAGIARDDPILSWARLVESESEPEEVDHRELRIWLLKIRRWCWRNGRISLPEIVRRPGSVTLTRTDLDVTLHMDAVDIRIRRMGLDLDPGWLPWFGRVVRFHYLYPGGTRA